MPKAFTEWAKSLGLLTPCPVLFLKGWEGQKQEKSMQKEGRKKRYEMMKEKRNRLGKRRKQEAWTLSSFPNQEFKC